MDLNEIAGFRLSWEISAEEINKRVSNGESRDDLRKRYMKSSSFTLGEYISFARPDEIAQLPAEYQALFLKG